MAAKIMTAAEHQAEAEQQAARAKKLITLNSGGPAHQFHMAAPVINAHQQQAFLHLAIARRDT